MDEFSMEVYHGGKLLNNPIRYEGVAINYFDGNEHDCWFAQELRNMIGKLGYMSYGKLRYRIIYFKFLELFVNRVLVGI